MLGKKQAIFTPAHRSSQKVMQISSSQYVAIFNSDFDYITTIYKSGYLPQLWSKCREMDWLKIANDRRSALRADGEGEQRSSPLLQVCFA